MGKEYTYSMPESFMKDQSVPARWRVLGIINGFAIAGKPCYASNEWFMKELDCSQQTVSTAFKELEELGEIHCVRTKRTRIAYRLKRETLTNLYLTYKSTCISDTNQLVPISDINSDNEIGEAKAPHILEVVEVSESETERKVRKGTKYPNARTVFSWFPKVEKSWDMNVTELMHAELLFERGESAVRKALAFVKSHEEDENFNYKVIKPSDLERKWEDLKLYAKRNS